MSKTHKVYVLIDERTGEWFAMSQTKDQLLKHPIPDVHMECWTYDGFFLMKKEQIKGN